MAGITTRLLFSTALANRLGYITIRIIASKLNGTYGIWDTAGGDIENPERDPTRFTSSEDLAKDINHFEVAGIRIMTASFDLSKSPSQGYFGGPIYSGPGNRRNRSEQRKSLSTEIEWYK